MNRREKTVRLSLAGAGLTLFVGMWGALYNHDTSGAPDATASGPVAAAVEAVPGRNQPLAASSAPLTTQAQAAPQTQTQQPAARAHTRTRAS